jgi:hypothetical protein
MPVVIINREEPTSPVDAVGSPTIVSSPEAPVAPAAQSPDSPMLSAYDAAAGGGGGGVPRFDTMVFDRVLTASPMPLSDVGESGEEGEEDASGDAYAYRYQYRLRPSGGEPEGEREVSRYGEDAGAGRGRFDADGEIIGDPGSPDKTGEVMLFPER